MGPDRFSAEVRRLIAGNMLSALGTGFTLPFLLIYLTDARGFDTRTAGYVIATLSAVGLLTAPLTGAISDRIGPWRVLVVALLLEAVGTALFALVTRPWHAFAAIATIGIGQAGTWPSQSALIAGLVPPERRARVFAVNFALLNLGIGIGGTVSGLFVRADDVGTFQVIYVLDAFSFVAFAVILATIRHVSIRPREREPGDTSGYRDLFRDRVFLRICAVTLLLSIAGYGQIHAGFPGFSREAAGVSTRTLGIAFAANTAVIVLAQLQVERRIQGRRRTRALAGVAVLWIVAWLVIGSSALTAGVLSAAAIVAGLAVFGVGETLWAPTSSTLVNEIAPPHLRGRYNAVSSVTWQLSGVVGPVIAGSMLDARLYGPFIGLLVAILAVVAFLAVRLERHLTRAQNGARAPGPLPGEVAPAV